MRKLAVYRLKPGMKIARPIYNANQQMLLASGTVLTATFIKKLEKLNIPAVYIDDDLLPGVEINDVVSDNTRYRAINYTKKIFHDFHYTRSLSGLDGMERVVNNILDDLLDNPTIMVNLVDIRSTDEYTFGHSVNTCILALITGLKMGYNESALKQLAMGAIMHDLGKTLVPVKILNKPGKLTAEEFDIIKKHSEYGYSVLKKARHFNAISALVALQHHERYNGSGYPHGLSGRQIHDFAAIVGLVDMYDALTADRVYRRAYPCHEAFEMLSAFGDYMFDYNIVKSFLHHVAAYPISSVVKLSTGEIGVVMENRPGFSLCPVVNIMFTAENEKLKYPVKLDLSTTPNVTIVSVIDDDEFNKLMDNKTGRQLFY
ncbi:HD-GYP domain-containing protein [Desulfallas thermosapovorans]|uniref:HD-GYP domain-containing protein (C-di-GMP phosphodiesterase class II) n=1 Tax=Desulfallas thermosapovorans DSM 6562 TaxID=1121431 RepID=A0A5S4ZQQ7_9FIRM|nr:HD-GYP domain-containing protein [Desulfallas thermosapovorans]TYO94940.1 HD-GYP domain-containing protein (c-di-GMP phosphodiesterase class II) [Desulfallas thermosapovorans DSM 6562]